ncbi:hypothetical protein CN03_11545 [Thalassolituus oleivorans]|uniref:hypothetical protein n=1 Tax=Thalassolituus oleivorans TaxID=187493 RepID=UPI000949495F|nr:hypothetical protein [Thalassolituus oleivorans]APR67510.1 hypothetical protein CN03_11545 [Thalassolituus oleivorans]
MSKNFSIDSAIFLAGFTAVLYAWSTAYYNGYLHVLHLDSDMMERSFHQVIYNGLLISFFPVLLTLILCAFVLYLYSHALLPIYVDWLKKSIGNKRKVIKFRRFLFGKRNSPVIEIKAKALFTKVAILALFFVLYVMSLIFFESTGKEKAQKLIETHLERENKRTQMVYTQIGEQENILRFLGCGTRNCAGIQEKTNLIFYYPSSVSYSYLYKYSNESGIQEVKIVDPKSQTPTD